MEIKVSWLDVFGDFGPPKQSNEEGSYYICTTTMPVSHTVHVAHAASQAAELLMHFFEGA